jgi:hypothetical protein
MSVTEENILQTLRDLEETVRTVRTANPKPDLMAVFARLEDLARQLPRDANPQLLHYLQRKSYEKARLWLEGVDPEKGTCGK